MSGLTAFALALMSLPAMLLGSSPAEAISFQAEFRSSTYRVRPGDDYADLLLEHQSGALLGSQTVTGVEDIRSTTIAGTDRDYSSLLTTSFVAAVTGTYSFQVGADWGRGGASIVVDDSSGAVLDEFVTRRDLWWNNDWNDRDVFTSVVTLQAGSSYSLGWVGFEDCCGGNVTYRFSVDGSAFQTFDDTNFAPYETPVPEPGTGLLLGLGLTLLAAARQER
jgi:hypothetical protein